MLRRLDSLRRCLPPGIAALVLATGCGDATSDLCAQAAAHLARCTGEPTQIAEPTCGADRAAELSAIVAQPCEQLLAVSAKADGILSACADSGEDADAVVAVVAAVNLRAGGGKGYPALLQVGGVATTMPAGARIRLRTPAAGEPAPQDPRWRPVAYPLTDAETCSCAGGPELCSLGTYEVRIEDRRYCRGWAYEGVPAYAYLECVATTVFSAAQACAAGRRITIAAVGDLLLHGELQQQAAWHAAHDPEALQQPDALQAGARGYSRLLQQVAPHLRRADLTIANMEGPLAAATSASRCEPLALAEDEYFDGVAYSGYPQFNAHPSFAHAIAAAGIDVVQTANNHALDRYGCGVDRTIAALEQAGVAHVGTVTSAQAAAGVSPERATLLRTVNGVKLALLAATYATNGLADDIGADHRWNTDDDRPQVAYIDRQCVLQTEQGYRWVEWPARNATCPARPAEQPANPALFEAIAEARTAADLVIVLIHWGEEYRLTPTAAQRELAHRLLDAGADVILGGHPHVLEPMERYVTTDPDSGARRETFVIYSLGNFLSAQRSIHRETGAILYLGITKPAGQRAVVNGVRYLPTTVLPGWTVPADDAWSVVPAAAGHASYAEALAQLGAGNALTPEEPLVTNPQCSTPAAPPAPASPRSVHQPR